MTIRRSMVIYKWFVYFKTNLIVIAVLVKILRTGAQAPVYFRQSYPSYLSVSMVALLQMIAGVVTK
jgi:hypothetical protein